MQPLMTPELIQGLGSMPDSPTRPIPPVYRMYLESPCLAAIGVNLVSLGPDLTLKRTSLVPALINHKCFDKLKYC